MGLPLALGTYWPLDSQLHDVLRSQRFAHCSWGAPIVLGTWAVPGSAVMETSSL